MTDVRIGRIVANMELVKSKVETIYEDNQFDNTKPLIGNKIDELPIELSAEEKSLIEQDAGVVANDISNWEWYEWDSDTLESQGLDRNMLEGDTKFYINYEHSEILFSVKTSREDSGDFYSEVGLESIYNDD